MKNKIKTIVCFILTFAMLITLLPPQAYEASTSMETVSGQENDNDILQAPYADAQEGVSLGDIASTGNTSTDDISLEDAQIVMELTDRRTEYSKEYKLDNGLNLAVVYSEPVHYKENGKWEEIDNTLSSHGSGESASYKNKAGAWQVEFPLQLDEKSKVKITKGDYTVSFLMSGELRLDTVMTELRASVGTAKASKVKKSQGKVHKYDYSKLKEQAQHPEVIRDNLRSRMTYSDVYTNTDVIYDLDTQQLKESIVINTYDPSVYGYVYTLDTGKLVPVLNEDGSVDLLTKNKGEVVMTMPAPFMIDNEESICTDVEVTLEKVKGTYQLTYLLPMEWMEDENRAWPVILDPAVKVAPGTKTNNIQDHFVAENYSASNTHKYLYAGHHATYGDMRTYIRFSEILDFAACDVLVNAKLKLYHMGGSSGSTIVEAHQVYDSWTTGTITWAGQPSWNTEIQDYCVVGSGTVYSWDVTDIAHGWYLGENTGLMLKAATSVENSSTANWKRFCSVEYNKTNTTYWPYLEITYLSANGLEDYWDYTTSSAGRAGSGYINNSTGNLTWVHSDLGFDGNVMPISISHIYNLSERSVNAYGVGKGWRTNFHQTVERADTGGYYIWTDGDGTKHHFNQKGSTGIYVDEDGLRLTLMIYSSGYIITDIYGNTSNFDSSGRLTSMTNNQTARSNITITYDGTNRIKEMKDGVGRVYKFTYENDLLKKISYHGKNKADGTTGAEIANVTFTHSSSKLTQITYKDGKKSYFTYDGTKLLTATDVDGYKVKFGYSTGITKRALSIEEYYNSNAGNKIIIDYAHNKTKISDSKNTVIHHYNDYGNLISSQDDQGNGEFYQYTANKYTETSVYGNQLRQVSQQQTTVKNMILDSSFEGGTSWTASSVASAQVISTKGYMGNKCLQVTVNNSSSFIGAYGSAISVPAGETCSFSAYVQCVSAMVQLGLETPSGSHVTSASHSPGSEWSRLEVSYTNISNSKVTIRPMVILSTGGTAYVDCVQAEITGGASSYNLIQNGDFSQSMYWSSGTGRTQDTSAVPQLDNTVYKITGSSTSSQSIYQTINVSGNKGDVFVLSGWAKGNSVPLNDTSRQFGLKITFNAIDGRTSETIISFNSAYDAAKDWQYIAGRAEAGVDYRNVKVELLYSYNMNEVYFDGIQLFKEEFGERYNYDANGNLSEVIDILGLKTTYEYSNNDPIRITDPSGLTTVNTYEKHNLKTSRQYYTESGEAADLPYYRYYYDDYGNLTEIQTQINDVINKTTAGYSTDGNHLVSITNERGDKTTYVYNSNTSVLESVQSPKQTGSTKTNYVYDEDMFYLTSASTTTDQGETMSVGYVYENDHLARVTTGSSVYSFVYNKYLLRESVSVGSTILSNYKYTDDVYHRLKEVAYSNEDKVKYTYDDLGRVITEEYCEDGSDNASRTITYEYNSLGALATMSDSKNKITTKYYYDSFGRSTGMYETGGSSTHRLKFSYDSQGRVQESTEYYGGSAFSTKYTYNVNGQLSGLQAGNSREDYKYDAGGRLLEWSTYHGDSTDPLIEKSIDYEWFENEVGESSTVNRPQMWTYEADGYSVIYTYSYDANGNIVSENVGGKTTTYVYDSANQLIRENNQAENRTWVWTYDNAGNIKSKKEYAYTTGALGSVISSKTYAYDQGTGKWGDLLVNYNGKVITYDSIGNTLSDGNWNYTWQEGRKLGQMSKSGTTWTFTYDANGMRIKRTNGSSTYNYGYHGSLLTHMTYGGNVLHFYYDASGRPLSVVYNGVTYYYVLNLQGDVVAILDSSGVQVVGYRYDSWGRLLETSGSMKLALGRYNPLRYRGYVYDEETGLYYVSSRYYNPEIGRWINADSVISGVGGNIIGYNMFAYCMNNPIIYDDPSGHWIETVFDLFSLGASVVEVVINPADPWAWAGLIGDAVDLLPGLTGAGETIRAAKMVKYTDEAIDASYATIKFVKASDMVDDFSDTGKMLSKFDHVDDYYKYTVSNLSDGKTVHKLFMNNGMTIPNSRLRIDGFNQLTQTIFELKPYNVQNLRKGVKQIMKYNDALGGGYNMVIVLY